jgi:hypothetical protein
MGRLPQPRDYARDRRYSRGRSRSMRLDGEAPIYGRICRDCGHMEFSLDAELVAGWLECPSCGGRRR